MERRRRKESMVMAWLMTTSQMMCVMSVYEPQIGRMEAEREDFNVMSVYEPHIGRMEAEREDFNVMSVYEPQIGRMEAEKEDFNVMSVYEPQIGRMEAEREDFNVMSVYEPQIGRMEAEREDFNVMSVYEPQIGRMEAEREDFNVMSVYEPQIGSMEAEKEDFNADVGVVEPGEEESVGRYGWGARNREGRSLVELVARNGLAVASCFFQKRESHKITYRSGQHKTELDLLIARTQQLWKIKDCKAVAEENVKTQQKPAVFVVPLKKKKQTKTVDRRTIKWWRCKVDVAVEYKERVTVKYAQ